MHQVGNGASGHLKTINAKRNPVYREPFKHYRESDGCFSSGRSVCATTVDGPDGGVAGGALNNIGVSSLAARGQWGAIVADRDRRSWWRRCATH